MHSFKGLSLTEILPTVLSTLLAHGTDVPSRLGEKTRELLHVHLELEKPWRKENLTFGRKASLPAQIAETMWLLAGRNDIGWLSHYLPRAKDYSDDGATWRGGYGPRIRSWGGRPHQNDSGTLGRDQIAYVVNLLCADPTTRRAVVQIYDPAVDSQPGKDTPCNDWLHFIQRDGRLDLHVAVRSNDALWGLSGINAFEWGALLEVVAKLAGFEVGSLHFSTTSLHLYDRHFARAEELAKAGWSSSALDSPRFEAGTTAELDALVAQWFEAEQLIREHAHQRTVQLVISDVADPMLASWLHVLNAHWNGAKLPAYLHGTRLAVALEASPQLKSEVAAPAVQTLGVMADYKVRHEAPTAMGEQIRLRKNVPGPGDFVEYCTRLHEQKSKAYGGSWRRRGEMLGIMANVARKLDRLGGGSTPDENYADTCVDLLVYLVKYELWLANPESSDDPKSVGTRLGDWVVRARINGSNSILPATVHERLNDLFDNLEGEVASNPDAEPPLAKMLILGTMLTLAARLALSAWEKYMVWQDDNALRVWQGYGG